MRYVVQYAGSVKACLWNMTLSRQGHVKVWAFIHWTIATIADAYRNDPVNRVSGKPLFKMHYVFKESGRFRAVDFIINDSAAAYGVLTLVYVDLN